MTKQNTGKTPFFKVGKSEALTPEERKAFKKLMKNKTQCEISVLIGVSRQTISNIKRVGSGHPSTIQKIRESINIPA